MIDKGPYWDGQGSLQPSQGSLRQSGHLCQSKGCCSLLSRHVSHPSFGRDVARCPTIAQDGFGWAVTGSYPRAQPQAALTFLLSSWLQGCVPESVDSRPGVAGTCATAAVGQGAHSFRELLAGWVWGFFGFSLLSSLISVPTGLAKTKTLGSLLDPLDLKVPPACSVA